MLDMQVTYKRKADGQGFVALFEGDNQQITLHAYDKQWFTLVVVEGNEALACGGSEYMALTLKRDDNGGVALLDENDNVILKIVFRGVDNATGKLLPPELGREDLEEARDNGKDYGDGYFLAKLGKTEYPDQEQVDILFFTWSPKMTDAFITLLDCMTRGEYPQDVNDVIK